ncbi:Extracellular calcium-sensing receptor [Dissostichus eleginoides]|uniref:Extracellular calcium-sensing receptor n=1 Tax=Dissostichus eleginoides TaxID=100907 RepID=A0AAD9CD78_DISEL|nr:Extracellular calcium-sensing receptor [Dissostichus eleginoides]
MVFAIEQINNSTELLPGIKLGYEIYDSCDSVSVAVNVAFQLSGGLDPVFNTGDKCSQSGMVMAVVGTSGSTSTISMSRIIGPFNIPQCVKLADSEPLALQSGGDVVIGGLFPLRFVAPKQQNSYHSKPQLTPSGPVLGKTTSVKGATYENYKGAAEKPSLVQRICTAQQTALF